MMSSQITNRATYHSAITMQNTPHTSILLVSQESSPCFMNWPCALCLEADGKVSFLQFADCKHRLVCSRCCEKQLLMCIEDGKRPKCFVEKCQAFMHTGEGSPFQYFDESLKDKWFKKEEYLAKRPSHLGTIRNCKVPDCQGYITSSSALHTQGRRTMKCLQCGKIYCEKCLRELHGDDPCLQRSKVSLPQGMKMCPRCEVILQKEGGCNKVTCSQCNLEFCFNCQENWSQQHAYCRGTITEGFLHIFYGIRERFYGIKEYIQNCSCQRADNTVVKEHELTR